MALIPHDGVESTPFTYTLGPGEKWSPETILALFDGSAAGSAFIPCVTFLTQDGKVVARDFPVQVSAGGQARVTYHPFLRQTIVGASFPNSAYSGQIIAATPFVYYPLDEAAGNTVFDQSGNGRNGTDTAGASGRLQNVQGLIVTSADGALFLRGSTTNTAGVSASFNFNPTAFSVECWILATGSDALNIFSVFNSGSAANLQLYQLRLNVGKAEFLVIDTLATVHTVTGAVDLRDGRAHYIVGVYDGANQVLYVDGLAVATLPAVFTPNGRSPGTLGVGMPSGLLSGTNVDGVIDEFALYSRALAASEVAAHFQKATTA